MLCKPCKHLKTRSVYHASYTPVKSPHEFTVPDNFEILDLRQLDRRLKYDQCDYGEGFKIVCTPEGLPLHKIVPGLATNEICLQIR